MHMPDLHNMKTNMLDQAFLCSLVSHKRFYTHDLDSLSLFCYES